MSRAMLVVVFALMVTGSANSQAQSQVIPALETMAEDYNYAFLVQNYCGHVVAVDADEVEKLQNLILTIMVDRHGDASTTTALSTALKQFAAAAEAEGLDSWCEFAATIIEIRYPELLLD